MSLDGLRAWIGEVERKLGARTRVFLVLAAIAVGGAGAAIYLALDAGEGAVSEAEVQRLQEQIDVLEQAAPAGTDPRVSRLEVELKALRAQVESLQGKGGATPRGGALEGGGGAGGDAQGTSADGESNAPGTAAGGEDRGTDEAAAKAKSELEQAAKDGTTDGGDERTEEKSK